MHEKEISDKQPYALHMQGLTVHMGPSFLPRYCIVLVLFIRKKKTLFFLVNKFMLKS